MFASYYTGMKLVVKIRCCLKYNQWLFLSGYSLFIITIFGACANRTLPSGNKAADYNAYDEDLSEIRPAYAPASTTVSVKVAVPSTTTENTRKSGAGFEPQHVNKQLDDVLETMNQKNRSVRYASGFRIQIYSGNERQQAEAAKLLVYQNFPELNTYLSYKQPTYRLKVGDFMRKVDAERYYSQIKALFSTAILQPDKVDIRRSLAIN